MRPSLSRPTLLWNGARIDVRRTVLSSVAAKPTGIARRRALSVGVTSIRTLKF